MYNTSWFIVIFSSLGKTFIDTFRLNTLSNYHWGRCKFDIYVLLNWISIHYILQVSISNHESQISWCIHDDCWRPSLIWNWIWIWNSRSIFNRWFPRILRKDEKYCMAFRIFVFSVFYDKRRCRRRINLWRADR